MNLYAYSNIERLDDIAKKNNIDIPRCRGYCLMSEETPIDIKELIEELNLPVEVCENLCTSIPFWTLNPKLGYLYSSKTRRLQLKYIVQDKTEINNRQFSNVRWYKIHGWKRRKLKLGIKQLKKKLAEQYKTFNKYCGRKDILYIHAKIGGSNWDNFKHEIIDNPWFIEKVDDWVDSAYCDIYAKIKLEEKE